MATADPTRNLRESRLLKLSTEFGARVIDDKSGLPVFHVSSPHVLIQASGYLKYTSARRQRTGVFFRGQTQLYGSLVPSLYRSIAAESGKQNNDLYLKSFLEKIESEKKVLRNVSAHAREPLLQHYGLKTRWIDIVDNVWVALWFACHRIRATGHCDEYLHFERRSARSESGSPAYAYVLLIEVPMEQVSSLQPGVFSGKTSELIDLRMSIPSFFLRPHAQHALLFRRTKRTADTTIDLMDHVVGVVRVSLEDALDWLGAGALLGVHALFPSPVYDFGYRELLSGQFTPSRRLGSVQHIGA